MPPERRQPRLVISLQLAATHDMRGVGQRREFPLMELVVLPRLFSVPHPFFTARMVTVVVVLMHRDHLARRIYDRNLQGKRVPQQQLSQPGRPITNSGIFW